ncbi:hypothetical protein AKJ16_DCAP25092 [Drosera capensis]
MGRPNMKPYTIHRPSTLISTSNSSGQPQPPVTCLFLCLSSSAREGVNQGAAWIPNRSDLVAASCFSRGKVVCQK